jgi:hypothetical protein
MLQSKLNAAKGSLPLREFPRQREIYLLIFQRSEGPWTYEGTLVLTWVATVARTATAGSSGAEHTLRTKNVKAVPAGR